MRATVVHFDGCPHWILALERLEYAIGYGGVGHVEVDLVSVASQEEALDRGMRGSPTIHIDGADPFPEAGVPLGMRCRIYTTEHGMNGAPSIAQMVEALRVAYNREIDARDATIDAFPASDPPEAGAPGLWAAGPEEAAPPPKTRGKDVAGRGGAAQQAFTGPLVIRENARTSYDSVCLC
jgi:hypothetical protein